MDEPNIVQQSAELARKGLASIDFIIEDGARSKPIPVARTVDPDGITRYVTLKPLIDEWRQNPEFVQGQGQLSTLDSFIALTNRHKNADSAIFGSLTKPSLTAVIDYTTLGHEPRRGKHRLSYTYPLSLEWTNWQGMSGQTMGQAQWAAFIEEHIAELATPYDAERSEYERLFSTKIALPTELVALSRGMQVNVESRVKNARVLQSGETEIVFDEVHKDGAGNKLTVPGLFVIQIPLFLEGEAVRLIVRLRYRQKDGHLIWFYQLYRPDLVLRNRLKNDFEHVSKETELPVFEGTPEA